MPIATTGFEAEGIAVSGMEQAERRFFQYMAIAIALTVLIGFGSFALLGRVRGAVPLEVHIHAAIFIAWIGLFVVQTTLIGHNQTRLHVTFGAFGLLLAPALVIAGTYTILECVRRGRVPAFFPDNLFLALGFLEMATFGVLFISAMALRRRSDWHRRLMLGAAIALIGAAWGRLLPMPLLGHYGGFAVMGMQLLYVAASLIADYRIRGKVHPANFANIVALLIQGVGTPLLSATPALIALAIALKGH